MAIVKLALAWAHRFGSIALSIVLAIAIAVPVANHAWDYWHAKIAAYTTAAAPAAKARLR